MYSKRCPIVLILFLLISLSSCGTRAEAMANSSVEYEKMVRESRRSPDQLYPTPLVMDFIQGVISYGEDFLGRRYGSRGPNGRRLDCSGYVSLLFGEFGIDIPHSSKALSKIATKVSIPVPGDLLFFTGRNARSKTVGHVALVVSNDNGNILMMHSTNSRGIIKEYLNKSPYFKRRFLYAGRIPEISEMWKDGIDPDVLIPPISRPGIYGTQLFPSLTLLFNCY